MLLRSMFTILAVILLAEHTISAPGGKHGIRGSGGSAKPIGKRGRPPIKGGGKGGAKSPAVQHKKDSNQHSLPLDILPYHYTVSIVPDFDNSTFFGEVTIDFEAERATQEIVLHAANLQIDYDKLVLTERRCIPPSTVEVTSASTAAASPSTPEYAALPSAATTPESPGTQSQTSKPEASINSEQSSAVPDKVAMPSPAPMVEAPVLQGGAPAMEETVAPAMEEAPVAMEEAPAAMEQSPAPPMEEAPVPPVKEVPSPSMEEAPAMEEVPVPAMEEAPVPAMEEAPVPAMEEAPVPAMEEAPVPAMEEVPVPAMEEVPVPPMEEVPVPPMEEVPVPPMEEAPVPPMEEAPVPPMEEAPVPPMEEAPVPPMEEAPVPPMEEAPVPPMEEAPVPPMEEASASLIAPAPGKTENPVAMEVAPVAMEEAPAAEEDAPTSAIADASAPGKAEILVTMEEALAPAKEEPQVPSVEETPDESGNKSHTTVAPVRLQEGAVSAEDLKVHDDVSSTHDETPVIMEEVPYMPGEAPVVHEAAPILHDDTPSIPEDDPVGNEKAEVGVVATSPSAAGGMLPELTTIKELPAETTTVKDTFNLAGEALKILEVLNRSDIPPFFKANLTDDDIVNLSDDDGIPGQEDDRIEHYMGKLEIRTDDLAIEDCQKVEVIQPPPSNFVPPPTEDKDGLEQTTAGMFNNIRIALEQLVQTTLAPLLAEQSNTTDIVPTSTRAPNDKLDILRSIDEQLGGGMNSLIKNPEMEITTVRKTNTEVATVGKTNAEVATVGKTNAEVTTVGKTNAEIATVGKTNAEIATVGKTNAEVTTVGKTSDVSDGKSATEITTNKITNNDQAILGKPGIIRIANEEISSIESTVEKQPEFALTSTEKMDVRGTTDGKFDMGTEPGSGSTTYMTETSDLERKEKTGGQQLTNSETTTLPEKTTIEGVTVQEATNLPIGSYLGTEWSVDLSKSVTTKDVSFNFSDFSTTEKSKEETTEYVSVTKTGTRKSRVRRAAPKRKRRPSNRNKLKQSLKLPTCTSEDMYEVRVDKALSSTRRTEVENPDIGVEIAKDKIKQDDHDTLVLPTKSSLQTGKRYRLTMSFSGKIANRPVGFYRSNYVVEEGGRRKSKYVATTVLEPIHARRVFPCLDDPRFRARFSLRIAHPPNLSAYSNMPASTTSDDVDSKSSSGIPSGWLWDRFETSPPMPTYLVAFFVGALARKSRTAAGAPGQNDLMVRVLARRERLRDASFALNLAPKVMMEMGQWLNKPTSLTKLDLLALPGPGPDAVENWGLVSFQERYLLTQPGLLSRFSVASVLSHELAHDWFGNLVTPHHWKYAWLSEGLATYSSARILNKIQPTWDVEDLASAAAYITALSYSDDNEAIPMQPKKITSNNYRAVFSPASYYKGYMTMRMLKGIIGEELLTGSLRRYVQDNAFGWAKSSRLWAAVNATAKEQNVTLDIPRSLPKLMASWIDEPGYPLVSITRNYTTGEVYVQQERYSPARSKVQSNATWWIPLRTWTEKTSGAMMQWLPPSSKSRAVRLNSPVPIGGDQWIMANAEFSGPFRVQYDLKNWNLLAGALPDGDLPRGAGAQLSADALSLASDGQLPFSVALKIVSSALESRTGDAHLTWSAASPVLRRIDRELRGTKASRPYRQWLHRLISPLDTWISFDARNDTVPDAILARHVTTVACSLAMPLCLTTGRSQFRTWMASNTPEPRVPIELRGALYCAAVRDGTSDTVWRFLWSKISTAPTDERIRILKGLGCTRDPDQAKRLLQLAADVKSPVYKKQLPTIVRSIAMHDTGPGVVLSFLAENIQRFNNDTKTLGRLISEVAPAINSKKDMKKLQGLLPQLTSSRTTVAKVSADATAAMERSQRISQGIFAYFNKSKKQT